MRSTDTRGDDATKTDPLDLEIAIDTRRAAELLGVTPITAAAWRARGEGPRWWRAGSRSVRYTLRDVIAWRDARRLGGGGAMLGGGGDGR